jgi:hypothetical protein
MRQSIATKYHGPTNTRGSRCKATSSSGLSLTVEWDDQLNSDDNHLAAAKALALKLGWRGSWVAGCTPTGCVFVNNDGDGFTIA